MAISSFDITFNPERLFYFVPCGKSGAITNCLHQKIYTFLKMKAKSLLWLLTLVFMGTITCAQEIYLTHNSLAQLTSEENIKIFSPSTEKHTLSRTQDVDNLEYLILDQDKISQLKQSPSSLVSIPVKTMHHDVVLKLYEVNILTDDYICISSSGENTSIKSDMKFYRGYVQGYPNSVVSMTLIQDELRIIYSHKKGNVVINKLDDTYIIYNDNDLKKEKNSTCGTTELYKDVKIGDLSSDKINSKSSIGSCVEIYIEADYKSYQDLGSVAATEAWILALFNEVATLYSNENITVSLSSTKIWDTADPYISSPSTSSVLTSFAGQVQDNYQGRLAHLVSTRNLGGGIAWVNVLCSSYFNNTSSGPYAVSTSLSSSVSSFPTYSWNVEVFAHELGHNFGSHHTHDCVWNGNNTQIDDCGSVAGYGGGACYDPNNLLLPASNQGTIMSYCHLGNNPGIGFNQGFGEQPGDLIRNYYNTATCVTGCEAEATCSDGILNGDETGIDCGGSLCPTCPPPANNICSSATDITNFINNGSINFPAANINANSSGKGPTASSYSGCNTFQSWCNNAIHNDVWYKVTIPSSSYEKGFLKVSTLGSTFDTQLAIWTSCSGNMLSANDDYWGSSNNYQSLTTAAVTPGDTYYIQVDGWSNTQSGDIMLNIEYYDLTGAVYYNGGTVIADWEATDVDGYTHYIDTETKKILLSVKRDGQNIGWLGISANMNCQVKANQNILDLGTAGCNAPYTNNTHWWVMNRTWDLDPTNQPSNPIAIRSYYSPFDYMLLTMANPSITSHLDLIHYKISGEVDLTISGNECHQLVDPSEYSEYIGINGEYTYHPYENDHYAEYIINSFSGGGGGGGANNLGALPIELSNFEAKELEIENKISWTTTSEVNNDVQIIEKSLDGQTGWIVVGSVNGHNELGKIQHYSLIDKHPFGTSYYRHKSIDYDESIQYSDIILLERKDRSFVTNVYPNPTNDQFNLVVESSEIQTMVWKLYDMKGALILSETVTNQIGTNTNTINVVHLPNGIYQLSVKRGEVVEVMRVTKN